MTRDVDDHWTGLACIDPAEVATYWPHARHLIRRAIEKTGLSDFAEIERETLAGHHLLWLVLGAGPVVEAAVTTQLVRVSGVKVCLIVACGGANRARWLRHLDGIEDYARQEGCAGMRIAGRKGWERALSGYRARHVVLSKQLN